MTSATHNGGGNSRTIANNYNAIVPSQPGYNSSTDYRGVASPQEEEQLRITERDDFVYIQDNKTDCSKVTAFVAEHMIAKYTELKAKGPLMLTNKDGVKREVTIENVVGMTKEEYAAYIKKVSSGLQDYIKSSQQTTVPNEHSKKADEAQKRIDAGKTALTGLEEEEAALKLQLEMMEKAKQEKKAKKLAEKALQTEKK